MHPFLSSGFDPMTPDEKAFFKQLGARIASLRNSAAITQVQLAETLNVSQQTVASWESAGGVCRSRPCPRWRVP
jgi:DNA-binding transcriptional regulator YiaG